MGLDWSGCSFWEKQGNNHAISIKKIRIWQLYQITFTESEYTSSAHQTNACSNSGIETLEQGVKYVQS